MLMLMQHEEFKKPRREKFDERARPRERAKKLTAQMRLSRKDV